LPGGLQTQGASSHPSWPGRAQRARAPSVGATRPGRGAGVPTPTRSLEPVRVLAHPRRPGALLRRDRRTRCAVDDRGGPPTGGTRGCGPRREHPRLRWCPGGRRNRAPGRPTPGSHLDPGDHDPAGPGHRTASPPNRGAPLPLDRECGRPDHGMAARRGGAPLAAGHRAGHRHRPGPSTSGRHGRFLRSCAGGGLAPG